MDARCVKGLQRFLFMATPQQNLAAWSALANANLICVPKLSRGEMTAE